MGTARSHNTTALWLILLAVLAGVTVDSLTKWAGQSLGTWQLLFLRWLFGLTFFLPIALKSPRSLAWQSPRVHLVRLAISLVACFCLYYSLAHLDLATCVTVFFAEPLFMLPLATLLVGERTGAADWGAGVAGFVGVLIIAHPGHQGVQVTVLVAAVGTLAFATMHVMNKRWSRTESTRAMMFWMAAMMTLCTALPGLAEWRSPRLITLILVGLIAATAFTYGAAWITAARIGRISRIANLSYLALPLSYLVGWTFFREPLKPNVLLGSLVILAAVVFAGRRNLRPPASSAP